MFKNTYQSGFISVLYAGGARPLSIWGQVVKNGHIRRVTDEDVKTLAVEVMGTNVATTYIVCPADRKNTLGIRLPFFVMVVKNMKKYFTFEIQILDDKNMSRRFRVSNYQSTTRVRPFSTSLPIGLTGGWNQIQFNLADFTRRAYGSSYLETLRIQIHANVRIRRIYFSDRLYAEDEMPQEFKLYVPIATQKRDKPMLRGAKEKEKIMVDKSTGLVAKRESQLAKEAAVATVDAPEPDVVPSGALPSPSETPRVDPDEPEVSQTVANEIDEQPTPSEPATDISEIHDFDEDAPLAEGQDADTVVETAPSEVGDEPIESQTVGDTSTETKDEVAASETTEVVEAAGEAPAAVIDEDEPAMEAVAE